jgi:hypothetical protein
MHIELVHAIDLPWQQSRSILSADDRHKHLCGLFAKCSDLARLDVCWLLGSVQCALYFVQSMSLCSCRFVTVNGDDVKTQDQTNSEYSNVELYSALSEPFS